MKYILPILVALAFTACSKGKSGKSQNTFSYDLPPNAPIPPVKYCFEQMTGGTHLDLDIEGDSAFGKISNGKQPYLKDGNFAGVIYGKTLIVNYKLKSDSGQQSREQQWKFVNDSIYLMNQTQSGSSTAMATFFKVPCK